jgi:predicted nucleotidyltransferase
MDYEELLVKFKNCEIDNRKNRVSFVQRLCEYLNFDVPFTRYKPIVLGTIKPESQGELNAKSVYDAYCYLLANPKTFFGEALLDKFFYILTGQTLDREIALNLQNHYHDFGDLPVLAKILDMHFFVYQAFGQSNVSERTIIAFLILNYLLVVHHLAPVRLFQRDFMAYEKIKLQYEQGDHETALLFFLGLIHMQKPFSKDYYANLKPIGSQTLIDMIKLDQDLLRKMFRVSALAIFGSFARHQIRFDSDIDILVKLDQNMSYEDKEKTIEELKRFMFSRYDRVCDVHDLFPYMDEKRLQGYEPYIKVF